MNGNRQDNPVTYVKDLPPSVHFKLNSLLNLQDKWQELAGVLGHWDMMAIEQFRMAGWRSQGSGGPTRLLIMDWQRYLPTVTEFYGALCQISMLHACQLLRDYVPEEMVRSLDNQGRHGVILPGNLRQGHTPQGALYQGQQSQGAMHQGPMYQRPMPQSHLYPGAMPQGSGNRGAMYQDIPMPVPPTTNAAYNHPQGHLRSQQGYTQCQGSYIPSQGDNYGGSTLPATSDKVFGEIDGSQLSTSMSKSSALTTSMSSMSLETGQYKGESSSLRPTPAIRHSLNNSTPSINPGDSINRGTTMIAALTFPYQEIQEATNNFDKKNLIGEGGFGFVYRAVLKRTVVAVKVLKDFERPEDDQDSLESNLTELSSLFTYRHVNIIRLIGYSVYGPKTCLVCEYMPNGSLEDRIQCKGGTEPLRWGERLTIMTGAASGLQFLHTAQEKPLIHGDIKSANILLDQSMQAKLSDFGQARQATSSTNTGNFTHITRDMTTCPIYATRAYLPRDFFQDCRLSVSTDTYSFGVVIFEVCTGQKALDYKRGPDGDEYLRDFVRNTNEKLGMEGLVREMDPVARDWPLSIYSAMMEIGLHCTERRKKGRPDMLMVHGSLQRLEGERRIMIFNQGLQRPPPQGSSDHSDSSWYPTGPPPGPYSPPHSHHVAYVSGEHQVGIVLQPPSSIGLSNSFKSCPSKGNPPDGTSDPPSTEDPRFSACDNSKLTHSEKICEARNAPLREADMAARMQRLNIDQPTGVRQAGEQSYPSADRQASYGSMVHSVPYSIQREYDEMNEERRKLVEYNAKHGLPVASKDTVLPDPPGQQRDSATPAGSDIPAGGSASSHGSSDITLAVTDHMALLNSKRKKSFPFASCLDTGDCDGCTDSQQEPAVGGPVAGATSQTRGLPTEGGIHEEGLPEGFNQSDRQRATENEVAPSPTSSYFQQNQGYYQQESPYTAVQPEQAPHYTPAIGNHRIHVPMTNAPQNDTQTQADIQSARFPRIPDHAQYSFAAPDSEEIHSSDLYCPSDCIEPNDGMEFLTRAHTEGQSSVSSTDDDDDQKRFARSLELRERTRQMNEPKESRDFVEQ